MTYLFLAVGCSLAIGMIFKYTGRRRLDRVALLTVNYAAAAGTALALVALGEKSIAAGLAPSPGLAALGAGAGVLYIAGFFLLSLATDAAGMSIATGVMRVSVVIPFLASWVIWGEQPTPTQGLGLICAGAAFFMIAWKRREAKPRRKPRSSAGDGVPAGRETESRRGAGVAPEVAVAARPASTAATAPQRTGGSARVFGVLLLLFLAGGLVDTCTKTFDEVFAEENSRALFLLMIFGVAFLVGVGGLALSRRRRRLGRAVLAWGALLGVVNYGSVEFILRALRTLRGPFVFPANNVSIVLGAALLGVWCWGERLSTLNKAGLVVAGLALFLLRP